MPLIFDINENRIPKSEFNGIDEMIFGAGKFGGPDLARRLDCRANTLWSLFNTNSGVPVSVALRITDAFIDWADELLRRAQQFRQTAYRIGADTSGQYKSKRIGKHNHMPTDVKRAYESQFPPPPLPPVGTIDPALLAQRQQMPVIPLQSSPRETDTGSPTINGSEPFPAGAVTQSEGLE